MSEEGYESHIDVAYDDYSRCADRKAWLSLLEKHPVWVCDLVIADSMLSEVINGGFMQFFVNSSGDAAPEAAKAFQRIGVPRAGDAVTAAMQVFGADYPPEKTARKAILWQKAGVEPQPSDYALFKSGLFDEMEDELCEAGGPDFEAIYDKMDEYAHKQAT